MIFIDMEQLLPEIRDWLGALELARIEVMAETDAKKRAKLIEKHQPCWTALRDAFERISHGKCWYTECRSSGADNDIDHFRPKLRIMEESGHPGYYWLAFDWLNMRLSSQRANRPRRDPSSKVTGGKADHFPLLPTGIRAKAPCDDLNREHPALLDPANPIDPPFLWFLPTGEIALSPNYKEVAIAKAKFEASRTCLHLNWPKFRDDRVMLYNNIERAVVRGQREAPEDFDGIPAASRAFLDTIRDLRRYMSPLEQYSAAARAYVESFRRIWWVNDIVLRV